MSLLKRGSIWWSYFFVDGVRHQQSTGTTNRRQAEAIERKLREEVNNQRFQIVKYDPDITAGLGPIELWQYVKKFKSPVLYIVGANSNLVPKETQAQLKATLPNIEVLSIPDAGHSPHQDNPQVWLAVVRAFLAG